MPFLILYCFVLFSFWLYLLLLTIKLNMGLLSLLWFKIWVFAKSNGGICSLTQTRLYEICSFKWKTENIVTYSLCVYFWILFQILDLVQNRNCTNAQFCAWICTGWKKKFKSLYNIYVCKYAYSVQLTQVLPIFVFVLACVSVMVFLFLFKIHVRWGLIAELKILGVKLAFCCSCIVHCLQMLPYCQICIQLYTAISLASNLGRSFTTIHWIYDQCVLLNLLETK